MELAEQYAEELPIFADYILKNRIVKSDNYTKFWERYKDIYLDWWINRYRVNSETNATITNYYKWAYNEIIWNIYCNTLSLYDSYEKFWLEELWNLDCVFFFDSTNSTFYIKDNWITEFLEKLNEWYLNAKQEVIKLKTKKRKAELEKELDKLNNQ